MSGAMRRLAAALTGILGLVALAPAAAASSPARLCVLYFDNNTGDARWDPLKKGLADMMVTDLSGVSGVDVVERDRLEEVLGELSLQQTKHFDDRTAQKLGALVGASYAVTGAITAVAPKIRLDIRLISVETGEVVLADKVVGEPDSFFELQALLTRLFVDALGKQVAGAGGSRVARLDTLLAFGEGLDLADKGDTKGASKRLGQVVAKDPGFALAKTRYTEVMQRLYAAKDKRESQMASGEERLVAKCDAELSGKDVTKLRGRALQRYFGYRILRGNLFLMRINARLGGSGRHRGAAIPAAARAEVKALMVGYRDNTRALIDALKAIGRKKTPSFPSVDTEDQRLAQELGGGTNPHRWSFQSPQYVARGLAHFLALGKSHFFCSVDLHVTPALAELDAAYAAEATALLDFALEDIAAHERLHQDRETVRTLDLYGDVLTALGRPVEAIAKWQQILDQYPTSSEFDQVEQKIRDALR